MRTLRPLILVVFFLIAGALSVEAATTFHVATSGADTNPGTSALPWRTLQWAVDHIAAGDTIVVQPGTYAGCRIGRSGTPTAVCTLMAASGSVLINSPSPANRHNSLIEVENFDATVRYWVIDGFEISGGGRYGVDLRDTDFITVQNCVVHHSGLTGIFLAFCYHPLIQNNESYLNGEHGIYQSNSGDSPIIRGNNLHENAAAGLHMNGDRNFTPGDGVISFAVVEKNVVWENGRSGGSGINCDGVSDSIIRNNLLYNNHASGISLYAIDGAQGSSRNRVYNNTIVMAADGRWCINIPASSEGQSDPVGNDVKNNILYTPHSFRGAVSTYGTAVSGFSSDYNVVVPRFSVTGGGSNMSLAQWQALGYDQHSVAATLDQLFNNPAADDYSLKPGAPAINAGVALTTDVRDDLSGVPRPQGGAWDVGCFETSGGGGPPPPPAPVADFSANPLSGVAPLAVTFTDLSTGNPTSWSWNFGDGGTSTSRNPSHTYQTTGAFTVTLTVSNAGGQNTRMRTNYVSVSAPASPPVADFSASPLGGNAPLPVQFTDQSTGAASWSWDFGDGGSSTLQNPSHLYSGGGVFTVTLTVGNSAGQNTKTRIAYITVTALPSAPVAEFFGGPLTGTAPLTVQFTDQSSGSPNAWSWDFGDGELSSQRNPSHTYDAPGTYTVRLTALNAGGQTTRTRTGYITVSPVSAADFLCTAVIVELGKLLGGDHINLQASDDSYLKAKAAKSDGLFSDQLSYTFRTGFGSLSTLSVRVESRPKKAPVRQQVFVFNPGTGNWELVDDRSLPTRSETSMTIGVSNPARFLSASGEVRVRIRTGDIAGGKWKHFIDQVKITAAP